MPGLYDFIRSMTLDSYLPDAQFYKDAGGGLMDALRGVVADVLPTGANPGSDVSLLPGARVDPAYLQKMANIGLAGLTVHHADPIYSGFDSPMGESVMNTPDGQW